MEHFLIFLYIITIFSSITLILVLGVILPSLKIIKLKIEHYDNKTILKLNKSIKDLERVIREDKYMERYCTGRRECRRSYTCGGV